MPLTDNWLGFMSVLNRWLWKKRKGLSGSI